MVERLRPLIVLVELVGWILPYLVLLMGCFIIHTDKQLVLLKL